MDIAAVLQQTDISKKITQLQNGRLQPAADIADIKLKIDVKGHDVNNPSKRADDIGTQVRSKADGTTYEQEVSVPVNRIALSLQTLIVERAVAFLFGNEVKINCEDDALLTAINSVNKDNKINSFNRQVARTCFQTCEVAEYWYAPDTESNDKYGFVSTKKLKCAIFSPLKGDQLYPFFDDFGDMVAFSRAFELKDNDGKLINMFETWTNDSYFRWKKTTKWEEDKNIKYPPKIKKIPIIYASQANVEWYIVQSLIDRLEKLLSNFGDTNDYFSSPMLFIKNSELISISPKNKQGKILQADGDADAKYLAWSQLPEPIKLEAETLLRFIFSITQTPDISFESVKGLGTNISGETLKMLFLDAHLKVMNKQETFDSYLTRRYNVVKAMLKVLNNSIADADVECIITPFMLNSESALVSDLITAVSGGIMSKESAVEQNPYVDDAMTEMERITNESNAATALDQHQNDLTNPTSKKPVAKKAAKKKVAVKKDVSSGK